MKRWLVALLLAVFCFHTLPVLELSKHACAWMAEDGADAEDDGAEEPAPPTEKEKQEETVKWCGSAAEHSLLRAQYDEEVRTALHDVAMRQLIVDREVVVPPPDAVA